MSLQVVPACHNSADSVTLSGPAEEVKVITDKLTEDGVFARQVDSSRVPFHSPLLGKLRAQLEERFSAIIPEPKARKAGWISTSVPPEGQALAFDGLCSAAYHVNNILSPVLFHQAVAAALPANAVTLEVGPHALLAAILRRSFPAPATHIGLMSKRAEDQVRATLGSLGKLYAAGLDFHWERLFPIVEWPVARGTPMVGHLIARAWDHKDDWPVMSGPNAGLSDVGGDASAVKVTFDPFNKEDTVSCPPRPPSASTEGTVFCAGGRVPGGPPDRRPAHLPLHGLPRHGLEGPVQGQGTRLPQHPRLLRRPPSPPPHAPHQAR